MIRWRSIPWGCNASLGVKGTMAPAPSATERRITGIDLIVADLARATAFYEGLGFTANTGGKARRTLSFGAFTLGLGAATRQARPCPPAPSANDPWFQHFCIAVADMPRAFTKLDGLGATPISRGGPQLLPPSTGSVVAYKFRDPDGHPLELSFIPGSDWLRDTSADVTFLGIDHTAIAVADLAASIAFYESLGFTVSGRFLNTGPEQDRLDGLDGVALDIVAMKLAADPHLELLRYRTPKPAAAIVVAESDIAATRTVISGLADAPRMLRDPDGHLITVSGSTVEA